MNQRKHTPDQPSLNELARLYAEGKTLAELAAISGFSDEKVRRLLRGAGIERRPRGQPAGKYLPNGGQTTDKDGYILLKANDHPNANSGGYMRQHRLVMEGVLGRYLLPKEIVHHINGIKDDNRPENLALYSSNAEHKADDMLGNSWALGDVGNPKRRVRTMRSEVEMLEAIQRLAATLNRPVQRTDLHPPMPSYRAIARAFGSWQEAVALALDDEYRQTVERERGRPFSAVRRSEGERRSSAC